MKKYFIYILLYLLPIAIYAQVKIGGAATNPHASSILELDGGTSRGFLLPRMSTVSMNAIVSPAEGLMIYNTTDFAVYIRTNNAWIKVGTGNGGGFTLPYSGSVNAPNIAAFSISNTGLNGAGIFGKTSVGLSGQAGVHGEGTLAGSYGIKGTSDFDGIGGYFNSKNKFALVTENGNIGFGTLNPNNAFLDINATESNENTSIMITDQNPIIQFRNTGANLQLQNKGFLQLTVSDFKIGTNAENTLGKFIVRTGGLDRIWVTRNGLTGIGTEAPTSKLEIDATSTNDLAMAINDQAPTIMLRNNGVDKGFVQVVGDDLKIGVNTTNNNGKFIIRTNGQDRVFVDNGGNMSIGSTQVATGYRLNIDGKVIAEEMRVQNSTAWPDYVFAPEYKLKSLPEIKSYISLHRHLPGIPSAIEIEKEGISLGKMQAMMMEKIEELTLHLIHAKEEIELLKKKIQLQDNE